MRCVLQLDDLRDLTAAVARCRRLLDLDADPVSIAAQLEADPVLGELARRRPGMRVPGCVDGFELAVRAIVGQQVSVAAARTVLGRLVERYGEPLRRAGRRDHAPLPHRRGARRGRPRRPALPAQARRGAALARPAGGGRRAALRRRRGLVGRARRAARHPRRRALDRLVRGDARARRPGRLPGRRRRHPARAAAARPARRGPRRTAIAEPWRPWRSLRRHAPVGASERGARRRPGGGPGPTRLPSAMFASTRCRPQLGSGDAVEDGRAAQRADHERVGAAGRAAARGRRSGDAPQAVDTSGCGTPSDADRRRRSCVPGANGSRGWIGVILAEPPPSAAGLVQSTSCPGSVGAAEDRVRGRGLAEGRERDHAAGLRARAAGADVLEVAAHVLALLDEHVAAEQHRRDQPLARAAAWGRSPSRPAGAARTCPASGRSAPRRGRGCSCAGSRARRRARPCRCARSPAASP